MSAAEASSATPAICLPFSITLSEASTIAAPDAMIDFEPPVPPPAISRSLSPCLSLMRSNGMPSLVVSTCANADQWPWP